MEPPSSFLKKIRVPGSFVVLQGNPGDGLSNTMDSLPRLPRRDSGRVPLNVIGSSVQEGLFPAVLHPLNGCKTTITDQQSMDTDGGEEKKDGCFNLGDSFIVVDETSRDCEKRSGTTETPRQPTMSEKESLQLVATAQAEASVEPPSPGDLAHSEQIELELWNRARMCRQRAQHEEWLETVLANRHHLQYDTQNNNKQISSTTIPVVCPETGQLAVFDGLLTEDNSTPRIIGSLAPGSTIIGTALVTLSSQDFTRIYHETQNDEYPPGRRGWIQFLRIDYTDASPRTTAKHPQAAFVVLSYNGYAYLGPGLPGQYTDPHCWIWRVTCIDGAYVRRGLDLSSEQLATIPYGSLVQVHRKSINAMGLSRLQVSASVVEEDDDDTSTVCGWVSEFLNPQSGQSGSILEPLPFPVPVLYRVLEDAILRSGIEVAHPPIGRAPAGSLVTVTGRAFSEHPATQCEKRLRLAGNGGWMSLYRPVDIATVEFEGLDPTFDPELAGLFHFRAMWKVEHQRMRPARVSPSISSVDEEDEESLSSSRNSLPHRRIDQKQPDPPGDPPMAAGSPTYTYRESSPPPETCNLKCVNCMSEDRTATIVHGGTGHICCCLQCARILKGRKAPCPLCRLPIDSVIQHFWS